jgi:hypothetical protein
MSAPIKAPVACRHVHAQLEAMVGFIKLLQR